MNQEAQKKQETQKKKEAQKKKEKPVKPAEKGSASQKRKRNDQFQWKRASKTILFWVLFILVVVSVTRFFGSAPPDALEVDYSRYRLLLENGRIQRAVIVDREFLGILTEPLRVTEGDKVRKYQKIVLNLGPIDADTKKEWEKYDVDFSFRERGGNWLGFLFQMLPWIFFIGLWLFIFRQMQSGPKGVFSFGKSRAKLLTEDKPKVTFKDVAGAEEAKQELQEIIEFLKDPAKFQRLGGRIPKGVLLVGPPGTGKTYMAKAVSGEADVPFFSMSGSDFVEMFVGVGASVTGDTPVLIRTETETRLMPIAQFVDPYYHEDAEGFPVSITGAQTLGFEEKDSKFKGSPKTFFGHSAWKSVSGVYRHRVREICEIHYLGGVLRTTGDHSVFVRTRNGIVSKPARDLKPGEVLVSLPFKTRGAYLPDVGTPHTVRAHLFDCSAGPHKLSLWEDQSECLDKYRFALENQGNLSQQAIAQAIGVSQATVGHWQRGIHQPQRLSRKSLKEDLPENVPVTPDLMKLFGYYTAEGRCNGCLEFVFGSHETDLHFDCTELMHKVFGLEPSLHPTESNTLRMVYYSAPLGRFFSRHCGNGSKNKHVPEWLWGLGRKYFKAYLEGYYLGDGYTTQEGKLSVTSASHRLITELAWLCSMHGIGVGIREVHQQGGRIIKEKPLPEGTSWNLIIGKTAHPFMDRADFPDQFKKLYVREVVVKPYEGYVYDLCGCENEAFFGGEKPVLLHNSRVRDLFVQGKNNAPCIIFVDEIDAVGRHRGAGIGGGHDEREQTLNQLLVEMDGFESNEGVIFMAATNRPDVLDPALLRPGRFDRVVVVDRPDVKGREGILRVHTRNIPLARNIRLNVLARGTPGLSGADLENLVNEAALLASRRNRKVVTMADFEEAKDKVMMGAERRSMVISDEEKKLIAYHEVGHTLVAKLIPGSDPIHKVTIIPRGRALGVTHSLPIDEKHTYSKSYCVGKLAQVLGGRVAELIAFGELTTGSGNDYEQATALARSMICEWGMSEKLGPLTYGKKEEEIFLGREIAQHRDYSEKTAQVIDEEVRGLVDEAEGTAMRLLRENEDKLHLLAETLLEFEVLDGTQIDKLLRGEKIRKATARQTPRRRSRSQSTQRRPSEAAKRDNRETGRVKKREEEKGKRES